jgi:cell division protein FtsQ
VPRAAAGLPLAFDDPDGDGDPRLGWRRFGEEPYDAPGGRWWRPASTAGRVFLTLGALLVFGGLTAAGLLLKTYLERDARFRINGTSDIQSTGLTEVSRAQLLPVFGEDIGRNIFFVPLDERRKDLEQIPWVERATVMRLLPDQIRVTVVERKPVAFARVDDQVGLVDANGVLLSMSPEAMAQHHYSFPVVTGVDPGDPAASRQARMAVYLRLMAELNSTGQNYSQQISEIDLTDPEDARVLMPEQGADILAHFGQDHFLERYLRYKAYIAQWRAQYPNLAAVDLRYDRQAVLEMASGKEAAETDAGEAKPQAGDRLGGSEGNAQPAGGNGATESKPAKAKAAQTRAVKNKAVRERKKPAAPAPRRAAAQASRRKPASRSHPAAAVAEGG